MCSQRKTTDCRAAQVHNKQKEGAEQEINHCSDSGSFPSEINVKKKLERHPEQAKETSGILLQKTSAYSIQQSNS